MKIGFEPFYQSKILNYIKKSDIIISCSDENYKEGSSLYALNIFWLLTWWSLLFSRTVDVSISTMFKKRVILFPNSVGPFKTSVGKLLAKLTFKKFSYILLRESISYEIVKKMNLNSKIILTGDAALLYEANNPLITTSSFTLRSSTTRSRSMACMFAYYHTTFRVSRMMI
jgi:polysaccharide pyruvyl transferase WcaK-like protein